MITVLETLGLKPVEAVGTTFDPNIHEAISHEEDDGSEPGTVIREFKKGYFLHDRLLRPATVSVSKAPETPEAEDDAEEAEE
jgi:molecular chaperone GrpE